MATRQSWRDHLAIMDLCAVCGWPGIPQVSLLLNLRTQEMPQMPWGNWMEGNTYECSCSVLWIVLYVGLSSGLFDKQMHDMGLCRNPLWNILNTKCKDNGRSLIKLWDHGPHSPVFCYVAKDPVRVSGASGAVHRGEALQDPRTTPFVEPPPTRWLQARPQPARKTPVMPLSASP